MRPTDDKPARRGPARGIRSRESLALFRQGEFDGVRGRPCRHHAG
jgi:hypothetical protein